MFYPLTVIALHFNHVVNTPSQHVVKALQPLRDAGYLTKYNGTTVAWGAVTVIGTGNTPLNLVSGVNNRDYFWDAPLALLDSTYNNITSSISPIASKQVAELSFTLRGRKAIGPY